MALIKHSQPCPDCGSSDALAIYDNGTHCFSCGKSTINGDSNKETDDIDMSLTLQEIKKLNSFDIPERGLRKETLEKYGVKVEMDQVTGLPCRYYFPYYKGSELVGYKIRDLDKKFGAVGTIKAVDLFGQNTVADSGQLIIITEGEFDALSAYQMLKDVGKDYKVVSLPNGANIKAIKDNLEFLERFDTVMLNFDSDEPGQKALSKAVDLFSPGTIKVMSLPEKDANDMIIKGHKSIEYYRALQTAKSYRPDGIVQLSDTWELMFSEDSVHSIPYPWEGLNRKLYGLRPREIVTFTSGTGMGKSAVTRELAHWLFKQTDDNIGVLALEESVQRTAWGIVSIEANLPLSIREERFGVSKEDIRRWFDATIGTGRIFTLDHFGSTSEDNLLSRIRYMIKSLGCKWIILDHLSIVVSDQEDVGDERKTIDAIMTKLRKLVEETGVGLILVSHLKRVGDKGHEQGLEVSLAHLRGSQSIAQLSDCVIALERNQQEDDETMANISRIRVLKNRYAGYLGLATNLFYDRDTGRLEEIPDMSEFLGGR